jgi:L-cysteine:1D-myo-inositol 2-amino-2-deoxy-alpha-D-glucopyranoside ligase
MQPWSAPQGPSPQALPGKGRLPEVFDTARGALAEVGSASSASMYVCGITPYDATHMGHAATYVAFDLLNRVWRDAGVKVRYVQNVTDVDDPLLERATATGVPWEELAHKEIRLFHDDMTALRVLPPDEYVGVVESIPLIADHVDRLRQSGVGYDVDGDLYFAAGAAESFGSVSHYDRPTMLELFAERGGDPDRTGKKDPLDWLLWRAERPGEPAWDSPVGRGRPGWHVECSTIAITYIGAPIDVQGGGRDLIFPHHEMCAAQVSAVAGKRFAGAFMHAGMVGFDGEKMSKSRGNLVFVSKLRAGGVDPMAIRLALLDHHYRGDWEWTSEGLAAAADRLQAWRAAVSRPSGPDGEAVLSVVRDHLADDLNAPAALHEIDAWASSDGDDASAPALVSSLADTLIGVSLRTQ